MQGIAIFTNPPKGKVLSTSKATYFPITHKQFDAEKNPSPEIVVFPNISCEGLSRSEFDQTFHSIPDGNLSLYAIIALIKAATVNDKLAAIKFVRFLDPRISLADAKRFVEFTQEYSPTFIRDLYLLLKETEEDEE